MAKAEQPRGPTKGKKRFTPKKKTAKKQTLVFDQDERINFVKGFQKRKQERRDRAKQEAELKDREMRKLLRQKRKEALTSHQRKMEESPSPTPLEDEQPTPEL